MGNMEKYYFFYLKLTEILASEYYDAKYLQ